MPNLKVAKPTNLPEYLKLVEQFQKSAGHSLWFRGSGKSKYRLIPSLYRHPSLTTQAELEELERQLMVRFRQRSIPYHTRNLSDDWEALFFMQHYGVPTRLLDWTENPLIGLHFALMQAPRASSPRKMLYKSPAVVWVLDPVAWNKSALRHVSYGGAPLVPSDEHLKGYLARSPGTPMHAHPVALYGAHNSSRMVAQQGVFAIFGANRTAMETLVRNGSFPSQSLACIVIDPKRIPAMRKSLLNHGITESVVFPDLEGLARETKRHFGFEA